jgi:hypothetical protein
VVAGVLVHPPAVAHADAEVASEQAGDLAGPPAAEDLPVRDVMRHEGELREDDRQARCHDQLVPRVADRGERHPTGDVQAGDQSDPREVVARSASHEAGCGDEV